MISSPLLRHAAGNIGGEWASTTGGRRFPVFNPATGELLAELPEMGADAARRAIEVAAQSMRVAPPLAERKVWLQTITEAFASNREELARIITLEQGKPLKESLVEVDYAAGFFKFYADHLESLAKPRTLSEKIRQCEWTVHQRPAGVAALISPWNFPLSQFSKKLSAALAAGCAVVLKPAELTPLSAIACWTLLEKAGLPMRRLNLVLGEAAPIGQVFCEDPAVRVISFTGSTKTGGLLARQAAPHIKRMALELGGNAPCIIFEDANVGETVEALVANKFRCSGQTCVCANRVYVHEEIHDQFVAALAERMSRLKVGNGLDAGTDIGPLINRDTFEKVRAHVTDAVSRGAERVQGAELHTPANEWGCFFPPTLLTHMTDTMLASREETFGPVVSVQSFRTEAAVISSANATPYGLAGYVFTGNAARARRCAEQLSFGHVAINSGSGPTPEAPFGGMKTSGIGREGGDEGLAEFTEIQTVATALNPPLSAMPG
jgi:succinate-semialdehyde dehydrogenase/glutarate-semialdehyde dehydrogenase